jgi:hypothetical protein
MKTYTAPCINIVDDSYNKDSCTNRSETRMPDFIQATGVNTPLFVAHNGSNILLNYQYPYKRRGDGKEPVVQFVLSFSEGSETYKFNVGLDGERSISYTYASGQEIQLPEYFSNTLASSLKIKTNPANRERKSVELFLIISRKIFCLHSFGSFKGMRCWFLIDCDQDEFHLSECFGEIVFQ